jgi:uncharacterized protein RhaS with RHS repeats
VKARRGGNGKGARPGGAGPSPHPRGAAPRDSYYRARYYDPTRSRFIGEDTVGVAGLANAYAYVRGNPLRFIDPLGLYTEVIQWGAAPGWRSMWGHISGNINGDNWSWGPGG